MLDERLIAYTMPNAPESQKVIFGKARFTVLAPELVRFEYDPRERFCDEATQIVWFRNLKECPFTVKRDEEKRLFIIVTEKASFIYNEKNRDITVVELDGKLIPADNSGNLKGTARTLDQSIGPVKLGGGVISRTGVSVIEDNSLILQKNGEVGARPREKDKYIFASKDYRRVLSLFYAITGKPPMVPRYSLGCWWSRYEKYTQDGYLKLMDRFIAEDIPITVATIDMDWHWVNLRKDVGFTKWQGAFIIMNGWTGYSWNTNLFPDYKQFLKELHEKNLAVTLNLHPAAGVRSFETQYPEMCKALGLDPEKKKQIKFDITSPEFLNAYFSVLHKPYERDGVDFWWIDWQQGTKSKLKGYDPLWACNHYHSLDSGDDHKRPLILSRYAGLGSHRYPLGFSGDAAILWRVLDFQPYFTVNAANVGYTAWSHDIGGHHLGFPSNDELYLRWIQFGIFTPVMRLHSTQGIIGKEPWNHPAVEEDTKKALRFRHRMIPYIYTAYYNNWKFGRPVCEPLYYEYPDEENAYKYRNQYNFGGSLIVAPVTSAGSDSGEGTVAETAVWLPKGEYTDIFTGERLSGGEYVLKRGLSSIPVFAKDGSIIPLANVKGNFSGNPDDMELLVFPGNGGYCLYEDDGISMSYQAEGGASTCFEIEEKDNIIFTKLPADGNLSTLPQKRTYRLKLYNINGFSAEAKLNGKPAEIQTEGGRIVIKDIAPSDKFEIIIKRKD